MKNHKKLTLSTRLTMIALDVVVYTFPFYIISAICFYLFVDFNYEDELDDFYSLFDSGFIYSLFMFLVGIVFYLNKDNQSGRSFAKKFYNLHIVDIGTGKTASPLKCVFRNLTYVVLPIEIFFIIRNPHRRLGDIIAGTEIREFKDVDIKKYDILEKSIAVIASIGLLMLFGLL